MSDASEVKLFVFDQGCLYQGGYKMDVPDGEKFMPVADHDRIVAAKDAAYDSLDNVNMKLNETIARQAKVIEKYQQAVTRIWVSSDNCEHDMEPNTTMDFFRCEKCGIPSAFAAIEQGEGM